MQMPSENGSQIPVLASRWPRLWARLIDNVIELVIAGGIAGVVAPAFANAPVFTGPGGGQLLSVALLPFALVLDAAIVSVFGNSPGKALLGLRVADIRGEQLPFVTLLRRNAGLWWWGLGIGFPIVNLVTMWRSGERLERHEILPWDRLNDTRCYSANNSSGRTAAGGLLWLLLVAAVSALTAWNVESSREDVLAATIDAVNRQGPTMVDAETRLDGAREGPAGELVYLYTFPAISADTHDLQEVKTFVSGQMTTDVKARACSAPDFKPFLDSGIPVIYAYSDSDGVPIHKIRVSAEICRGQ